MCVCGGAYFKSIYNSKGFIDSVMVLMDLVKKNEENKLLKKVSTFPGVLKHPINFLQFPFVHTLTVREGAVFRPRVGYSLLSMSFHTIICENGPNKFQMSQNISFARKCFGENSQKR